MYGQIVRISARSSKLMDGTGFYDEA